MSKFFENKNVLLVGLGLLGGGRSMAEFILAEGGILTVTDLRSESELSEEVDYLKKNSFGKTIEFFLGEHRQEIFEHVDVVVFNPAVPYNSKWPQYCKEHGITFYNDFTLFQEYIFNKYADKDFKPKQIWITGTRGKTTTTNFTKDLLGENAVIGGNQPGNSLQKICYIDSEFLVLETSNHQLEYPIQNNKILEPDACIITNIFVDHVTRHGSFEEYKKVKHKVFEYNKNAKLFLLEGEKTVQDVYEKKFHENIAFIKPADNENISKNQNIALGFAIAVSKLFGVSKDVIDKRILSLTFPKMRQEKIRKIRNITFINDSAATSPDALLSCMESYPNAVFIAGGTNANLDFTDLVGKIRDSKMLENNKIKFLKGTATDVILELLGVSSAQSEKIVFDNFTTCLNHILSENKDELSEFEVILSPGAKSFGLFKNEYDRGEQFNKAVMELF